MLHFCTYFDHNYLSRGLTLYDSLRGHSSDFTLHVLALTPRCHEILKALALADINVIDLRSLEAELPELRAVKPGRKTVEYYFTLSPVWPRWLLDNYRDIDIITYVDGDTYFFDDPSLALAEMGGSSVAITPHRFPPRLEKLAKHGIYNVGWVGFRRDKEALACLDWWRAKCLEWCGDTVMGEGLYADQGYLDSWPERFANVRVIDHTGINMAPWNIAGSRLSAAPAGAVGSPVLADGRPLIFYHFHGLGQMFGLLYYPRLVEYQAPHTGLVRSHIYKPYVRALRRNEERLRRVAPDACTRGALARAGRIKMKKFLPAALKGDVIVAFGQRCL